MRARVVQVGDLLLSHQDKDPNPLTSYIPEPQWKHHVEQKPREDWLDDFIANQNEPVISNGNCVGSIRQGNIQVITLK